MIVSKVPHVTHNLKGIGRPLAIMFLWDTAVTVAWVIDRADFGGIALQVSLFGTAIALFIGFAVNASYARWWEARTLWGAVVNSSRTLACEAVTLLDESGLHTGPDGLGTSHPGPGEVLVHGQIAYVHLLRTSLRGQPEPAEVARNLTVSAHAEIVGVANTCNAVLTGQGRLVAQARRHGMLDAVTQVQFEETLADLSNAQGGLERIKNTPLPVQYRFFPAFFARLFCLILPFAVVGDLGYATPIGSALVGLMFLIAVQIGRDLADPFTDGVYDVPMTTLCRTIEIDLLETLGKPSPEKLTPVDAVLW